MTELDHTDQMLLRDRIKCFDAHRGPRVGDFVIFPDGEYRRFTHDWGDGIQTTCKNMSFGASFYFDRDGWMSFSGGLDPSIPKTRLFETAETREGLAWFFHHDRAFAHNGVNVMVPCRVYRYLP